MNEYDDVNVSLDPYGAQTRADVHRLAQASRPAADEGGGRRWWTDAEARPRGRVAGPPASGLRSSRRLRQQRG